MPKVLVADDSRVMRLWAQRLLGGAGYEVVTAENGQEAVTLYAQYAPDAVLLDVTMPVMDGVTALAEIRARDPAARIAMLTAMGQEAIVRRCLEIGIQDFIMKPQDDDRVLATVAKLVKR